MAVATTISTVVSTAVMKAVGTVVETTIVTAAWIEHKYPCQNEMEHKDPSRKNFKPIIIMSNVKSLAYPPQLEDFPSISEFDCF